MFICHDNIIYNYTYSNILQVYSTSVIRLHGIHTSINETVNNKYHTMHLAVFCCV